MKFVGIDLHTNKFTCCYRDNSSPTEEKGGKVTKTFDLSAYGLTSFYMTLTPDTYVLLEATITSFAFVRLIQPFVKEVIVANTYELKQISLAAKKTDKVDADKLCRIIKMQVLSGERAVTPVTIPPEGIQELRGLFSTYRLLKKQTSQTKNRIHSVVKERLYGYTQEEIFSKKRRKELLELETGTTMSFHLNLLFSELEQLEEHIETLQDMIKELAEPYMREIEILTSMKGVSVFIAIAVIADIISVDRFKNSKAFTSYLRSAPRVSSSNTSVKNKGTNKRGRKLAATLLTQSLNHVLDASPKLARWYARLTEGKKAGLVRTGLRRKVLSEMYQMLKKGEYHYGREANKHAAKIIEYKKLLEKRHKILKTA